jgi:hypothetical protein
MAAITWSREIHYHYHDALPIDVNAQHPGGLCMPETLEQAGETIVVTLDPWVALKLHVKHLECGSGLLPVCGLWGPARTPIMLEECSHRRHIVLWSHTEDADLFRHAFKTAAMVASATDSSEETSRQIGRYNAAYWVAKTIRAAVPWETALERKLAALPDPEAETLILGINFDTLSLERFLAGCTPACRERFDFLAGSGGRVRKVVFRGGVVAEKPGGWFWSHRSSTRGGGGMDLSNDLIVNAPFRIEQVVHQQRQNRTFYRGHVIWRGQRVPFVADKAAFDDKPFQWLADHLIRLNLGVLVYGSHWAKDAVAVACLFNQPELVHGSDLYGWDYGRAAFVFPGFLIKSSGRIVDNPDIRIEGSAPAQNLRPPAPLNDIDLAALSGRDPTTALAWSLTLCVLANLLAPTRHLDTAGFIMPSDGRLATPLLRALGCTTGTVNDEHRHSWPLLIEYLTDNDVLTSRWLATEKHNCLVMLRPPDDLSAGTYTGWGRIDPSRATLASPALLDALTKVVPAFLARLALENFRWVRPEEEPWTALVRELDAWRADLGLGRLGKLRAVPPGPGLVVKAFAELLARLFEEGSLGFTRAGFRTAKQTTQPSLVYLNDKVWIPKAGTNMALARRHRLPISAPDVTRALAMTGVLLDEVDHAGEPGWLVGEPWWDEMLHSYRGCVRLLRKTKTEKS